MKRVGSAAVVALSLATGLFFHPPAYAQEGEPAVTTGAAADTVVAWLALALLVMTLVVCLARVWRYREAWFRADPPGRLHARPNWAIGVLGVAGLGVAGYLAYHKLSNTSIACGLLAGCDTVQDSRFSTFLWIPVGVWGMLAYTAALALWIIGEFGGSHPTVRPWDGRLGRRLVDWSRPAALILALFSVLFSTYLTGLEALVIRATCTWCVGSAMIWALIGWLLACDRAWLPTVVVKKPRRHRKARH